LNSKYLNKVNLKHGIAIECSQAAPAIKGHTSTRTTKIAADFVKVFETLAVKQFTNSS